jgi:hypothetical protein
MTLETVSHHPPRHRVNEGGLRAAEAQRPYCGQPISRKEFKQIQARIEADGRERLAKVETALQQRFARDMAQAEAKRIAEIKTLKANQEAVIAARLKTQREASEKKLAEAVNAERTKAYDERMLLDARLQGLQRRLQRKTSNELGDEGELDLFQELKREFPNDEIERVKKGKEGGDIIHQIIGPMGQTCGKIIYDVKNTSRFMSKYLTKLRADQLREEADHAVLCTQAFPAGSQQLAVVNGVVIAHPARAMAVANLLRRQIVQVHALRLDKQGREQKAQALYAFMISPRAAELWDEIAKATEGFRALDLSEKTAHEKTWGRRADLIRAVQGVHDEFSAAMDRIIGGTEASL